MPSTFASPAVEEKPDEGDSRQVGLTHAAVGAETLGAGPQGEGHSHAQLVKMPGRAAGTMQAHRKQVDDTGKSSGIWGSLG